MLVSFSLEVVGHWPIRANETEEVARVLTAIKVRTSGSQLQRVGSFYHPRCKVLYRFLGLWARGLIGHQTALIIIQAGGKSRTYMLSPTVFAGSSVQGHPQNSVQHLSLEILSPNSTRQEKRKSP